MMSNHVIVIGNGQSRSNINLISVASKFTTIGCNAIHRQVSVNKLICCDQRTALEALKSQNTKETQITVRKDFYDLIRTRFPEHNIDIVPDLPFDIKKRQDQPEHWGSGPYALLAGTLTSDNVILIGFDLYGINGKINNVFKGTENYNDVESQAVDPSYWIYQCALIFNRFKEKTFTLVNHQSWKIPDQWTLNNVNLITTDYFNKHVAC